MSETDAPAPQFLERADGVRLAYHRTPGQAPGLIFLGGFASDMDGSKAQTLEVYRARARPGLPALSTTRATASPPGGSPRAPSGSGATTR
ncbi:MAG: hypothetical protein U5L06_04630 [Rhodovibrio sp.]|nr:hypothetical protein [Rhodovibrio sp.]